MNAGMSMRIVVPRLRKATMSVVPTARIDVIETAATEAIIQTSNQTKWRMVQVDPKELRFPPPDCAGAPATYWVVKSLIFEQPAANSTPKSN